MRVRMLFLALALAGFSAHSENSDDENKGRVIAKPVLADTPEAFATQARWIEDEMEPGGRYEFAKAADKQRVKVVLEQMGTLLQRAGSVAAMDQGTKVVLFNDQEEINGLLTHNDANRLVCESRQPVGSHIPVTHSTPIGRSRKQRATRRPVCNSTTCRACAMAAAPTAIRVLRGGCSSAAAVPAATDYSGKLAASGMTVIFVVLEISIPDNGWTQ